MAQPPFDLWPLAWFFPVPLLIVAATSGVMRTAVAAYGAGVIAISQTAYGILGYSTAAWVGATVVGPVWTVLPFAAACILRKAFGRGGLWLCAPVLWVACEALLVEGLGAPVDLAITQARSQYAIQLVSLGGPGMLAFVMVAGAALSARAWLRPEVSRLRRCLGSLGAVVGSLAATCALGALLLQQQPLEECLARVSVIQPDIPFAKARDGWLNPAARKSIREDFDAALQVALQSEALDLIVWPEGGGSFLSFRVGSTRTELSAAARRSGRHLLITATDFDPDARKFNSVFSLGVDGAVARYAKRWPVPFAEDGTSPGDAWGLMETPAGRAGVLICYEASVSEPARRLTAQDAAFLVVSTSDAAFGLSSLSELHLSTSILRAVENRRAVIHASNRGPSALIAPTGRVTGRTGPYEEALLKGCVLAPGPTTLYTRIGFAFRRLCVFGSLLVFAAAAARSRRRSFARGEARLSAGGGLALLFLCAATAGGLATLNFAAIAAAAGASWAEALGSLSEAALEPPAPGISRCHAPRFVASFYGLSGEDSGAGGLLCPETAGLEATAERLAEAGFRVELDRIGIDELVTERMPVIVGLEQSHQAVVLEASGDALLIAENSLGVGSIAREVLQGVFTGQVLRVRTPLAEWSPPFAAESTARRASSPRRVGRSLEALLTEYEMAP